MELTIPTPEEILVPRNTQEDENTDLGPEHEVIPSTKLDETSGELFVKKSKKDKRKDRKSQALETMLEPSETLDPVANAPEASVEPIIESTQEQDEVKEFHKDQPISASRKGKKGKKAKSLDWTLDEQEKTAEPSLMVGIAGVGAAAAMASLRADTSGHDTSREAETQKEDLFEQTSLAESDSKAMDKTLMAEGGVPSESSHLPDGLLSSTSIEKTPQPSEEDFGSFYVKKSKKDKKKAKKTQSWGFEDPEEPNEVMQESKLTEASTRDPIETTTFVSGDVEPAQAPDNETPFSTKKSKKDKKKAKKTLSWGFDEPTTPIDTVNDHDPVDLEAESAIKPSQVEVVEPRATSDDLAASVTENQKELVEASTTQEPQMPTENLNDRDVVEKEAQRTVKSLHTEVNDPLSILNGPGGPGGPDAFATTKSEEQVEASSMQDWGQETPQTPEPDRNPQSVAAKVFDTPAEAAPTSEETPFLQEAATEEIEDIASKKGRKTKKTKKAWAASWDEPDETARGLNESVDDNARGPEFPSTPAAVALAEDDSFSSKKTKKDKRKAKKYLLFSQEEPVEEDARTSKPWTEVDPSGDIGVEPNSTVALDTEIPEATAEKPHVIDQPSFRQQDELESIDRQEVGESQDGEDFSAFATVKKSKKSKGKEQQTWTPDAQQSQTIPLTPEDTDMAKDEASGKVEGPALGNEPRFESSRGVHSDQVIAQPQSWELDAQESQTVPMTPGFTDEVEDDASRQAKKPTPEPDHKFESSREIHSDQIVEYPAGKELLSPAADPTTENFCDDQSTRVQETADHTSHGEQAYPMTPASEADDWSAGFGSKKKKGKKSKKGKATELDSGDHPNLLASEEDKTVFAQPHAPGTSDAIENKSAADASLPSSMVTSQLEQEQKDDDWTGFTSNKRSKGKKAKKQQFQARDTVQEAPEALPATTEDAATMETERSLPKEMENETYRPSLTAETSTSESAWMPGAAVVTAAVPALLSHESQSGLDNVEREQDPDLESEWAPSNHKKSKKGKDKSRPFDEQTLDEDPKAYKAVIDDDKGLEIEQEQSINKTLVSAQADDERHQIGVKDVPPDVQPEAVEDVDFWGLPVRKRSKKGKKGKVQTSAAEEASTIDESQEPLPGHKRDLNHANEPVQRSRFPLSGPTTAAGAVGAGIAIFEGLNRVNSTTEDQPPKKSRKKSKQSSDSGKELPLFEDEQIHHEPQDMSDHEFQAPSAARALHEFRETHPAYRDSAVHMDSPVVDDHSYHQESVRDSGFQDGQAQPPYDSHDTAPHKRNRSLDVSVEVDPSYDVTISGPGYAHATVGHLPEDSALDLPAHKYTEQLSSRPTVLEREPSPIDSTTKDRSASLFGSSPSTRDDVQQHHTHRSIDEITSPTQHRSIFGGPTGNISDPNVEALRSPPRTPIDFGTPSRPLTTIAEQSPEESAHSKKTVELSDSGQFEHALRPTRRSERAHSISDRRTRSPHPDNPRRLGLLSTEDIISRLSWPDVDDEKHSVDLERSRSRNTDKDRQSPGQGSRPPSLTIDPRRSQDQARRSTSGASVGSNESISAIIRSPPPISTPPLRRVDRSLSGDLRAANKRSPSDASEKAEKRGKARATDVQLQPDITENIASSSTYDPVTDKGKGRIVKMTDFYVS